MTTLRWLLVPLLALAPACGTTGDDDGDDGIDPPPVLTPDPADEGCSPLFAQGILPRYYVTISQTEWDAMNDEFLNRVEREAAGMPKAPYHPITLRYEDGVREPVEVPNVLIRLKGASSWLQTIALDANPKMQFVIAFNEIDPEGRFLGVRKVELDMPRSDRTFIRHRLALHYLRTAGTYAQCANNARLFINGEYYGLYSHIERLDKEFIQRHFPEADDGDLWESGRVIKTNEETFTWDRIDALWHDADSPPELEAMADVDTSIYEWAAEAVAGDADGYYNGRANFYLYDHPVRGFIWIPNDLDTAYDNDFLPYDASPQFPNCIGRWEPDWRHYLMMLNDPTQMDRYTTALDDARAMLDVENLQSRLDFFTEQIAAAAEADDHRIFTMDEHAMALDSSRRYVANRAQYIDEYLSCRASGGADGDGDGFVWCRECDDTTAARSPNAAEVCNGVDDNCNGRIDDIPGGCQ
jgi:hypothetical protein